MTKCNVEWVEYVKEGVERKAKIDVSTVQGNRVKLVYSPFKDGFDYHVAHRLEERGPVRVYVDDPQNNRRLVAELEWGRQGEIALNNSGTKRLRFDHLDSREY